MDRTLVLVKPGAVQRGIVGAVISRLENKGLKIVGMKMLTMSQPLAREFYAVHEEKDFYVPLVKFMVSGPVVAMALEAPGAVGIVRNLLGTAKAGDAAAGTIRGDFALSNRCNVLHASDNNDTAARELALMFADGELMDYEKPSEPWTWCDVDICPGEPVGY